MREVKTSLNIFYLFIKRYRIALIIFLVILVLYFIFIKPNPVVRVDANKIIFYKDTPTLELDSPTEIEGVGKNFTVNVRLKTNGYLINAVSSYLEYDPKALEVASISTENSFCKFYPENSFSNEKGFVKLSCGTPYPGFSGESKVETITFVSKALKTTKIQISKDSLVLANDGKGTNLLKEFNFAPIKIKAVL